MKKIPSILVIDDELPIRQSLSDYMEDEGYNVITAESAEDAVEIVKNNKIDLAVVDLRLPDKDGTWFIATAHKINPTLKFVIHTGSVHFQITDDMEKIPIQETQLFLKPLRDLQVLADKIGDLLHE